MKYTIKDFGTQFPDDAACLAYIFAQRHPKGSSCPKCGREDSFTPIVKRRAYACICGHHIAPTGGTIFHKSRTSLKTWFHAMFLMTASKNGVSAMELQRQTGVTYKCAWRMAHQIRQLMQQDETMLSGMVEIDETYVGGSRRMSAKMENKTPVILLVVCFRCSNSRIGTNGKSVKGRFRLCRPFAKRLGNKRNGRDEE